MTDLSVIENISPGDEMFQADRSVHGQAAEDHYFSVGQSALECIQVALRAARIPDNSITRILDLPCGHGRVLRYLRAAFPDAAITACDLNRSGVDYCAATFRAIPVYSDQNPSSVRLPDDAFDLIWVGSLLTHVSSQRWPDFLGLFRRCLKPDGLLVFSTHGRRIYEAIVAGSSTYGLPYWRLTALVRGFERAGFGYAQYSRYHSYGISLSAPAWVMNQVVRTPELRLVHASEHPWDEYQDIYACVRDLQCRPMNAPAITWKTALKHSIRERLSGDGV